jgi:serine/threonine protein kinase
MCTLGFPFDSFEAILNNEAPDLPSAYSSNLNKLYKKLVEKDPENRFSIRQAKKLIYEKFNKRIYEVPEKVSVLKKKKYRSPSASVIRSPQNTKIPAKNHANDSGISSQQKPCILKNNRNYKSIVRTHVDYECDISYCVKLNVQLPTKLCFVCGKDIKIGEKYRRTNKTGKIFHEECRKCNACDGPLGETYKFKNSSMYCHKCYDSSSSSV